MYYTYDRNNKPDKPYAYLASANKDYIGTIQAREISGDLCYNNISQISFVVNKYENGIKTENYDEIENLMLVEISYTSWFQITTCNEVGTGLNSRKEITALSLENEATSKILTSFGQLGVDTDEQGGLDRYCLYNLNDIDHSILHIFIDKLPSWSIGYVDPEITKEYRSFTDDSIGAYAFLTTSVAEAFECVFSFNTFDQTVSAYTLANAGRDTQIFLDYKNLIKKLNKKSEASDIFTVMTVAGGDDRGSTMGIVEVNPAGSNQIYNFEYFKPKMSESLRTKLTEYEVAYENLKESFGVQLDRWNTLIDELGKLKTKYPENESSTNWTEYGLSSLQTKSDYYHERMSQYTTSNQNASYKENQRIWAAINAEIAVRKAQITAKEAEIAAQEKLVQGMKINLREFLGETLFKELSRYWHETTFTDSTFIVTDKMTEAEAFQMRRDLLNAALTKLATVSKPQFTLDIDAVNFTEIPEFMDYTKELELGNIITVDMGDGLITEARILKIHMDWDKPDNFSITISSKNSLDGFEYEFAEILSLPNAAGTANAISGAGWNNAKAKVPEFDDYKSGNLDLQKQKLLSGKGEEVVVDTTGMLLKRFDYSQNKYSDNQLWATSNGICLTKNSWQDVAMAIGEGEYNGGRLYGVWADLICGDLLLSKELRILNADSSIVLNEKGATFKDCDITITRGASVLSLNATDGIKITKSGVNQFYVDGSGNIVFAGNLSGATGTFSGQMTAGSININNRFIVDSNGNATIGGYATTSELNAVSSTASSAASTANSLYYGLQTGTTTINGGCITTGTINAKFVTGGTLTGVVFNSVGSDANMKIENGNILINGFNGYLRGANSMASTSYSKIIGMSSNGNIVIGHDSSVYSEYGGSTQTVNMYTDSFNIKRNSNGQSTSVNITGSLSVSGSFNPSSVSTDSIYLSGTSLYVNGGTSLTSYLGGQFASSTHSHSISNLSVSYTGSDNIIFSGAHNGASVTYCQRTFERKSSSDVRLKHSILPLEELPDDLFFSLKAKQYGFKSNIYNDKINFGFIAQQVESAFLSHGLDPFKYNLIELEETRDYTDEGLYVKDMVHRINYNNFISWNVSMTQKLYKKVDEQKSRIDSLEERVAQLEQKLLN